MSGVPNKSVIDWFFKCPECSHFGLVATKEKCKKTNIACHFHQLHEAQCARDSSYGNPTKVQKLQILLGSGSFISIFLCITNIFTNTGRMVNPDTPASTYSNFKFEQVEEKVSEAPWLDKLSWPSYRHYLRIKKVSIDVLRGLVSLSTQQRYVLYAECVHYFQAATFYLEKYTPQVCKKVTKG